MYYLYENVPLCTNAVHSTTIKLPYKHEVEGSKPSHDGIFMVAQGKSAYCLCFLNLLFYVVLYKLFYCKRGSWKNLFISLKV